MKTFLMLTGILIMFLGCCIEQLEIAAPVILGGIALIAFSKKMRITA